MADGTATLRGLTIGVGTPYRWERWPEGLLGTADIRVDDQPNPRRAGVTAGNDYPALKRIAFEVHIAGADRAEIVQRVSVLQAAFAPSTLDEWLDVELYGGTFAPFSLRGRPRGAAVSLGRKFTAGAYGRARCVFVATDPVAYGPEQSVGIGLATAGTSTLPFLLPVILGAGGGSGTGEAVNAGTAAVDWTATLTGPLTNPQLSLVGSGSFVRVAATIAPGETVVLDSDSGAILLSGTTPRPAWFGTGSRWFQLGAGANSLQLVADSGSGSALVSWRPGRS